MDQPNGDDGEQPDDEHECRHEKGPGLVSQSPEVESSDDEQDSQNPHCHREGSSDGEGGGQLPHTSRNGDGNRQGVIDDQGGTGKLAGPTPEIVTCHRIGTATLGVGVNDLAVGDDQDDQESDDHQGDGHDQPK